MKEESVLGSKYQSVGWALLVVGILVVWSPAAAEDLQGVVVESVGGGALATAGVQEGDLLLSWTRLPNPPANPEAARGEIASTFDWEWLRLEQAPRGIVKLAGQRGGVEQEFTIAPGVWEATIRPWMPDGVLDYYSRKQNEEEGLWEGRAVIEGSWQLRCWGLLKAAEAWAEQERWGRAHTAYDAALEEARELLAKVLLWRAIGIAYVEQGELDLALSAFHSARHMQGEIWREENLLLAQVLTDLAEVAWAQRDMSRVVELSKQALGIRKRLAPGSFGVAETLNNLGVVIGYTGNLKLASDYLQEALRIKENLMPGSITIALGYDNLGALMARRELWDEAVSFHQQALEISQGLEPDGLQVANIVHNLGFVAKGRGELFRAEELYERSMKIRQALEPSGLALAGTLNNLGVIASDRGDLVRSMDFHQRAVRIREELSPNSLDLAGSLHNLASVAWRRGDLTRAVELDQRALAIRRAQAPGSLAVSSTLNSLGVLARELGDLEEARKYFRESLAIRRKQTSGGLYTAVSLENLGIVEYLDGDLEKAEEYYRHALEIQQSLAPGSLQVARSLSQLGDTFARSGDLGQAMSFFQRALAIRQELSPDSVEVAKLLHRIGLIHLNGEPRQPVLADTYLRRALDALEQQLVQFGASHDVRGAFRAQFGQLYRDAIGIQLELEQADTAFATLERSRARSFLEQLSERDTVFAVDIPVELDRSRRRLAVQFDRTQGQLAGLSTRDNVEQFEDLRKELRRLRDEARDIEERIRRTSPKLATLRYPQPLDLESAQSALDPGTLLLSYSVGEERTVLFTLSSIGGFHVRILPFGEEALRAQITHLRSLILQALPGSSLGQWRLQRLQAVSGELFSALLGPVTEQIAASERLLIVPDGPLHSLPFAALISDGEEGRYLIEWKPLHVVLSATVFAGLKEQRRSESGRNIRQGSLQLAAFGAPSYPQRLTEAQEDSTSDDLVHDAMVRSVVGRGIFDWQPLPYSRYEVESIAALFPDGNAFTYLGPRALEERVKGLDRELGILHIAAHGHTDEHLPSNSFIALSIPDTMEGKNDNGLLQVWEIFENVRINADLVVLSACESGLGQELGAEGLIGLTRAFQYAGARSVVASLWSVADRTTAEFMIRFYRHMRSGLPKAEALQAAQLELIRGPIEVRDQDGKALGIDASAPYYWAAFQLYGDWY